MKMLHQPITLHLCTVLFMLISWLYEPIKFSCIFTFVLIILVCIRGASRKDKLTLAVRVQKLCGKIFIRRLWIIMIWLVSVHLFSTSKFWSRLEYERRLINSDKLPLNQHLQWRQQHQTAAAAVTTTVQILQSVITMMVTWRSLFLWSGIVHLEWLSHQVSLFLLLLCWTLILSRSCLFQS